MFSFFRRSSKESTENIAAAKESDTIHTDTALIAVISAAIARFRESDGSQHAEAGFVVRRVRRI